MKHTWKQLTAMLLTLALCMGLLPTALLTTEAAAAEDGMTTVELTVTYGQTKARTMLDMINDFRTGDDAWYWNSDDTTKTTCTDLSELTYDYTLEAVAMQRAAEIALSYSHTRPNGESCGTALYVYYTWGTDLYAYGENIAAGYNSFTEAAEVFEAWQETDEDYSGQGHRRNMLSESFTAVGIACVTYGNAHFWVQIFGEPTTLNTTATAANDSETTVSIEAEDASVTSVAMAATPASYSLSCGDSEALPTVTAELTMTNTWPSSTSRTVAVVSPAWSSSDTSVATVDSDNSVVHAVTKGSASLTASALGETATASVTVNHGSTDIQNARDATCTEEGYTGDEVCTVCGETVTAGTTIPAAGHTTEIQNARDATCTEEGYTGDEVCTVCGETVTAGTTIPATGHTTEVRNARDATCTEEGYTGDEVCTVCGETVTAGTTIPATGHSYVAIVTEPTCTVGGYTTYTCSVCGDSYIADQTEATGHSYVDGVCTVCGEKEPGEGEHTHSYTAEMIAAATCTEDGVMTYTCSGCGDSYTEAIPATGHSYAAVVTEPTCTVGGYTTYTCSACGDSYIADQTEATGHSYVNGVCTVCGAEEAKEVTYDTGLYKMDGEWYYYVDGVWQRDYTGLVKYTNGSGSWYYVENGKINFNYTGLVKHTTGSWYYVVNGKMQSSFTGLAKHTSSSWYYVVNGKMQSSFTGLAKHTSGSWYYVVKGKMQSSYTGLAKHTSGTWYYVVKGRMQSSFTGIATHSTGSQWYVKSGRVQTGYTGRVTYNGKTYTIVKGKVV